MANLINNPNFLNRFLNRPYPKFGTSSDNWILHVPTDRDESQTDISEVEMVKDGRFQSVMRVDTSNYKKEWVRLLQEIDPGKIPFGKLFDISFDVMCRDNPHPVQWVGLVRTSSTKKYESLFRLRFADKASEKWINFSRQRVIDDYVEGEKYYIAISIEPGISELLLSNFSLAEAGTLPPEAAAVVPARRLTAAANAPYQTLLPHGPVSPAKGKPALGVISWSVSHNPLGRAYLLADMLKDDYDVELVGPLMPAWGKSVWEPVADSTAFPIHYFHADNFAQFILRSITFVKAHPYKIVVACKARFPSLFIGLLYKLIHEAAVVVDVDDLELAFFDTDSGLTLDELLATVKESDWDQPYAGLWTRYADSMLDLADGLTVSNPQLQKRFGGDIIVHARDEKVFDPKLYDRQATRADLGFKPSDKIVLFLGTPRPHKGLNEIGSALNEMEDKDVVFCIMGRIRQPEIRADLERFNHVRLALFGDQPFSRAAELVNIADVICVWQDESLITDNQFPAKLTDGMAMGVPILVRPVPPMKALLAQGAVIDVEREGLKTALTRILSDSSVRESQGKVARETYEREFGYHSVRPLLLAAVGKAVATRRPVPAAYARLITAIEHDLSIYPDDFAQLMSAISGTAPAQPGTTGVKSVKAVARPETKADVRLVALPQVRPQVKPQASSDPAVPAPSNPDLNLVQNPQFRRWQDDVHQAVTRRYQETAANWRVDFRSGTQPDMSVSLTEVPNIGGFSRAYGLRVHLGPIPSGGYARLIATLEDRRPAPGTYNFSCGLRTPLDATLGVLAIRELFLANLKTAPSGQMTLERLASVRKNTVVHHTTRLRNLPVTITAEMLARLGPDDRIALAFDFDGTGDIVIFEPELHAARPIPAAPEANQGLFEDDNIRSQLKMLKLSPLWQSGKPMSQFGQVPRARVTARRPGTTPFVQIVIPVYNAALDVEDCVRSILANTTSPFEIILSDDGSEAYTRDRLNDMAQSDPRVRLHTNVKNLGYTRNINQALQQTVADYVVLLNSDVIVSPGWIDKLYAALNASPDTAAAGPLSNAASWQSVPLTKSASEWAVNALFSGMSVDDMADLIGRLSRADYPVFPLLNGFCTMFRRRVLEEAGFFADDAFPMGYGEENDLCLRINRLGYCLRVADNAYVYHKKSRSFGVDRRKELSKKANVLLRKRHPEINFNALEASMRDCAPINTLRAGLIGAMQVEIEALQSSAPSEPAEDDFETLANVVSL